MAGDNLGLVVRPAEFGRQAAPLAGYGTRVYTSFGERVAEEGRRDDAARDRRRAIRRRCGVLMAVALGGLAAGVVAWLLPDRFGLAESPAGLAAAAAVGPAWGVLLFLWHDATVQRLTRGYYSFTAASLLLALAGTAAGLVLGVPAFGAVGGAAVALLATLLLGNVVPTLALLGEPAE